MSEREIKQLEKAKCKAQRSHNLKEEASVCNQLGELLGRTGQYREAIEEHRQERVICEGLADVIGCAIANRKIGECFAELGNFEAALKHQRLHLDLARSVCSDVEEQRALATIGRTYLYMCDTGRADEAKGPAEEAFLKSLAIVDEKLEGKVSVRELNEMRARLYLNLGLLYDQLKRTDKCSFYIRKSVFISEQNQLFEDLYRANFTLAGIHMRNKEHSKAIRCWEAARECARRMRDKHMESECYSSIGQVLLSLGDLSAGKRSLKKSFLLGFRDLTDRDIVRRNLKYAMKGCRVEEALSELSEEDQQGALCLYEQLGDLYCKVGCYTRAIEYYKMQLNCAESLGKPERELAVIHVSLAATFTDLKEHTQAVKHYQAELELRKGNPSEECKTWMNIALSYEEDGREPRDIHSCLSSALQCARRAGETVLQRKVLRQLLALQEKLGDPEVGDTEAKLQELCSGVSGECSEEEEEMENSEPLQESDLELSQSEDDEDLDGYEKLVPGKRRVNRWKRRNEKGETVLHRACIEGNIKLVKSLLEKGHPLSPRDYCGWTPLHEAANHGHLEIVQILLDKGTNINDPGGPLCEGITPLHDALSSGNFLVAQLLIRRGASVTMKNGKGVTPLGSLQEWIRTYGKHLDQETRQNCKETESLLREALAGRVAAEPSQPETLQDSELFDAEGSQPDSLAPSWDSRADQERTEPHRERRRSDRTTLPKNVPLSALDEEQDDFLSSSPSIYTSTQAGGDFSEEPFEQLLTPLKPVKKRPRFEGKLPLSDSALVREPLDEPEAENPSFLPIHQARLPNSGMEQYQKAMRDLGSAKSRLLTQSLAQPTSFTQDTLSKMALVPSEEYLDDDWLEDDLQEASRSRKRQCRSPTFTPSIEEDSPVSSQESDVVAQLPRVREKLPTRSLSVSKKRSRQTKLTQIVDRTVVGRTKDPVQNNTFISRVQESAPTRLLSSAKDSSGLVSPIIIQPTGVMLNPTVPPPIRVRVRVQDNIFLIPIPHSDGESREISWLADQAAQRYYQSCGLLPRLTLKKEGALLAPQDLILHVLQSNEEVLAEVHSWDLPPLTERYKKACQSLAVEENGLLLKALERQESSPCLTFSHLSLRPRALGPLLRALKLQNSLRQLHLSGNLLGDTEASELLAVLSTMPNLTHLNLSSNRLTHEGIRRLANRTGAQEDGPFKSLEHLDLSVNPLGDGLSQPLALLLHSCPVLGTLHLRGCQLSAKFLQQYRMQLSEAFRAVHLRTLSLSHNPLGSTGLELVLKTLAPDTLTRLDIKAVASGNKEGLLIEPLVRYLSQDGCVLSHLSLSCNHLTDVSVRELARCLPVCPPLVSIDLSGNSGIGADGLEYLLEGIGERNTEMVDLNLTGCSIRGPLSSSCLDAISSSLCELRLASHCLSKMDRDSLAQAWHGDPLVLNRQHKIFCKSR
ncbi:tonsoku-like protein isoform X2 [Xenopus laevis]|uniref:Tonsoku-like protein n=1 Tax=Xenopus laevis TaxID=8355 RepID=A0A8J1L2Z7_XENLA|nr:tonsoku-like protein isoform X2 [Xenopus laevis]